MTGESSEPIRVEIKLDGQMYSEEAVMKACHGLAAIVTAEIMRESSGWVVVLEGSPTGVASGRKRLLTDVLDGELRARLQAQTAPLRALIIAEAFSRTSVLQHELESADPAQDPLHIGHPDVATGRIEAQPRSRRV